MVPPRTPVRVFITLVVAFVAALAIGTAAHAADLPEPKVWNFDAVDVGSDPPQWLIPTTIKNAGWAAAVVDVGGGKEGRCVELSCNPVEGKSAPFGNLMLAIDATPYRGKKVVFAASVRLPDAGSSRAQLWLRVDRPDEQPGYFENMSDRPIMSREFKPFTLSGRVHDDATTINVGLMVIGGNGPAQLDDVSLTAAEPLKQRFSPPAPLSDRGLVNLEALTRVIGYLRHYHPSDQCAAANWDALAIDAVVACEPAETPEQLAAALTTTFAPYAPTARFSAAAITDKFDPDALVPKDAKPTRRTWWQHNGFGGAKGVSGMVYRSARKQAELAEPPASGTPARTDVIERALPGGVFIRIPLALATDGAGTLPQVPQPTPAAASTEPTGEDRATRLAAVMLAWNVCQHFYPYFDVVKTDWNAALTAALKRAAEDNDTQAFAETLRELAAALFDGHGYAAPPAPPISCILPINATFVGDDLVVTAASMGAEAKCSPGDTILQIAGRDMADIIADARRYEPASTDQHFKHRTIIRILSRPTTDSVALRFRTHDGIERTSAIRPVDLQFWPREARPEPVEELKPGVVYIDVDRADPAALKDAMPKLQAATGIVVDVRGYPSRFPMTFLGQLTDTALQSPQWHIPVCNFPDAEKRTFDQSGWPIMPMKPRLKAKVAFITDGRAVSAAETFMGIVEHYRLGDIVGEPTAGTNGNVNVLDLPAGFKFMFTGMKVLRHDGSQFHAIGVRPTVPVQRTKAGIAAGRDEMLEKAIEVVSAAAAPAQATEKPASSPATQPSPDADKRD